MRSRLRRPRTRGERRNHHRTTRPAKGRPAETRRFVAETAFAAASKHLESVFATTLFVLGRAAGDRPGIPHPHEQHPRLDDGQGAGGVTRNVLR